MKKKKGIMIVSVILIISLIAIIAFLLLTKKDSKIEISKDYLVKLSGGYGEVTYHAYIYETDSKTQKYKYVLTTATTKSYGSSEWDEKIDKEGFAEDMDEAIAIAKEHKCEYAVYQNKNYSLEDFLKEFEKK